ncbi:unnamed protein product, partial [Mesorhabditis spiculigera]
MSQLLWLADAPLDSLTTCTDSPTSFGTACISSSVCCISARNGLPASGSATHVFSCDERLTKALKLGSVYYCKRCYQDINRWTGPHGGCGDARADHLNGRVDYKGVRDCRQCMVEMALVHGWIPNTQQIGLCRAAGVSMSNGLLAQVEGTVDNMGTNFMMTDKNRLQWEKGNRGSQTLEVTNNCATQQDLKIMCSDRLHFRFNPVFSSVPPGGKVIIQIDARAKTTTTARMRIFYQSNQGNDDGLKIFAEKAQRSERILLEIIV